MDFLYSTVYSHFRAFQCSCHAVLTGCINFLHYPSNKYGTLQKAADKCSSSLLLCLTFIHFVYKNTFKTPSPEILRHDDSHQRADNLVINKIQGQSPSLTSTDTLQKRTEIYSPQNFNSTELMLDKLENFS